MAELMLRTRLVPVLRGAASLVAAGGVVAGGLLLGAEPSIASAKGRASRNALVLAGPTPDAAAEVSLGAGMQLFGQPAQLSTFWTEDRVEDVVDYYVTLWSEAGLHPTTRVLDRVRSVAAADPNTGLMRSVTVMDGEDVRLVIPSVVDMRQVPDLSPASAPVPIPETAGAYLANATDDVNALSFHATYVVALTPEQVLRFYRRELTPAGYAVRDDSERASEGTRTIEYQRDAEAITVVASPTSDAKDVAAARGTKAGGTSFVVVTHTRALDLGEEP